MKLICTNKLKCVKCRKCVNVCPMSVITVDNEGFPIPTTFAYKLCINCGYCVDICAYDALFHQVRKHSTNSKAALNRYDALLKKRKGEMNEK